MLRLRINNYRFILLFSLIASLISSCGNDRLTKCREVITVALVVNQKTEENLGSKNIEDVTSVADVFEQSSQQIKNIKIKDEQLKEYTQKLSDIYQEYANTTRNFIDATKAENIDSARLHTKEIEKLFEKQKPLVTQINQYCRL